ncbi:SDR family oxidoreductase [Streptomyces sp. NPDC050211]|uniref:SDR family NAD(P)-dependent oxidoreductase n=1 Tax=Streptomyces sp. NPDC050211 TaxID=3154932 RepID=UPI003424C782
MADLGRLDVLVNNAGAPSLGTVETVTPEEWRGALAINLDALFHTSRASIRHLRDTRGSVINVGSMAALHADYGMVAYSTAKGAVANLTRAMAMDHAPEVRVNAVHPGFTLDTGFTAGLTPDSVVAFLTSAEGHWINGKILRANGGMV